MACEHQGNNTSSPRTVPMIITIARTDESVFLTRVLSQETKRVLGIVLGRDWSTETGVVKIFDHCGLDMTREQPPDEVSSDDGISRENVSWR